MSEELQLFEGKRIRHIYDEENNKWYFSIEDIVKILTDSINPKDYIKKLRKRDEELSEGWGQIVTPLKMQTAGGLQKVNCADMAGIFRIIQSIPSKKAEPIKQWLAKVGQERVQEMADPLNAIQLVPGIKFIGNLKNGWQPYATIQMVWNIMDDTKFKANNVALPQMSVDPYVQYGVGVQKSWGDRFTGFLQGLVRNGGRNGVALMAGFNWTIGK